MQKLSKTIVIGGPIAVGKSTLVSSLPFPQVQELDPNDEIQKLLLRKLYEGDIFGAQLFQMDLIYTRFNKYKEVANKETHVFDRMIFEDYIFAKKLLSKDKNVWAYYEGIWTDLVDQVVNEVGKPRLYILLTCSWETFEQRIFHRNRKSEIDNFEANRAYFKELIDEYEDFMKSIFEKYNLDHVIINTDEMSILEVIETAQDALKVRGIL